MNVRTAVLVIHGVGQQQPYQTLDQFASGFVQALRRITAREWNILHRIVADEAGLAQPATRNEASVGISTGSAVRLLPDPAAAVGGEPLTHVDIHEVCWSPLVQRRVRFAQVLKFYTVTALSPLRYFKENLSRLDLETKAAIDESRARRSPEELQAVRQHKVVRELMRIALLYVPVALGLVALGWAAQVGAAVLEQLSLRGAQAIWHFLVTLPVWTLLILASEALLGTLVVVTGRALFTRSTPENMDAATYDAWRKELAIATFLLAAAFAALAWRYRGGAMFLYSKLPIVQTVLAGAALFAIDAFMKLVVDYAGDVTIYVSMDENSTYFATRQIILDAATDKLRWILKRDEYDLVVVAGHSLGSVVAHNAINKLILEAEREDNPQGGVTWQELAKIRLLTTFGSPLDKVDYFFRTHVGQTERIRAQILADRYPFARRLPVGPLAWGHEFGDLAF